MALFAAEHYLLIGLYTFALALATVNIWRILVKQRRYKTLPLLAFYICAFIAIALRWIYTIVVYTDFNWKYSVDDCFLVAKLSTGLIQSWMTFEIALRERRTYQQDAAAISTESFEQRVKFGQFSVIFAALAFIVFALICDLTGISVIHENYDVEVTIFAYSYLVMFLLMASVQILLILILRQKRQAALFRSSESTYELRKESCILNAIMFFFELSYLSRFSWDMYEMNSERSEYYYVIGYDASLYFDVLPFIGLLLLHHSNFKQRHLEHKE